MNLKQLIYNAGGLGIELDWIVENAGTTIKQAALNLLGRKTEIQAIVLAGRSFWGSAALAAARQLSGHGWQITVILDEQDQIEDALYRVAYEKQWRIIENLRFSLHIVRANQSPLPDLSSYDLMISGLESLERLAELAPAIPCPLITPGSGANDALSSAQTVYVLLEDEVGPVGQTIVADLGLPLETRKGIGPGDLQQFDFARPSVARKGDYGKVLVVGGGWGRYAAPWWAGMAALRTGIDYADVFVPASALLAGQAYLSYLHAFWSPGDYLTESCLSALGTQLEKGYRAVLLGPGISTHASVREVLPQIVHMVQDRGLPLILDADALKINLLSVCSSQTPVIITPNQTEFHTLFGLDPQQTPLTRLTTTVQQLAAEHNLVIVLKGSCDIITDGHQLRLNYTGNPGMTKGGTGDILSGLLAGFVAQGVASFAGACLSAYMCGAAGDLAFQRWGHAMTCPDILNCLPDILMKWLWRHE